MTTQLAVKLPDETVAELDELVRAGRFRSRSHAVRVGLDLVVRNARRDLVDQAFVEGFRAVPERPDELADAQRLARDAIEDEPWDKWW